MKLFFFHSILYIFNFLRFDAVFRELLEKDLTDDTKSKMGLCSKDVCCCC